MIIEQNITKIEQIKDHHLRLELEDYSEICTKIREAISNGKGPKWLIIAVNKADLYYNNLSDVESYYHPKSSSPFGQITKKLITQVGENQLKIIAMPICSWPKEYKWHQSIIKSKIKNVEDQRALTKHFIAKMSILSSNT